MLIGPSGCGKSTLLRLMIGLITPDTGTVKFDGAPLTPDNIDAIRHRIGYVIQDGGLFPHLSALGNVTLLARYLRKPSDWIGSASASSRRWCASRTDTLARFPVRSLGRRASTGRADARAHARS